MDRVNHIPVLLIAVILVIGVVYGAGLWMFDSDIPIEYTDPITIEMSDEDQLNEEEIKDRWQQIKLRDKTERVHEANFSYNDPPNQFYTYVRINNTQGERDVNVSVTVEEPDNFEDQMNFTVRKGIVEPGLIDDVDEQGSIEYQANVSKGNFTFFTVVYSLHEDAPEPDEPVIWNFRDVTDEQG